MKISKDLNKVVDVKAVSYSTIRRRHCKFKTEKQQARWGCPNSASNKSNVAAVAKLAKEDHTSVFEKCKLFPFG